MLAIDLDIGDVVLEDGGNVDLVMLDMLSSLLMEFKTRSGMSIIGGAVRSRNEEGRGGEMQSASASACACACACRWMRASAVAMAAWAASQRGTLNEQDVMTNSARQNRRVSYLWEGAL